MTDDRRYLLAFCQALPELLLVTRAQGAEAALEEAAERVRAGTPVLHVLPRLGIPPHVLTGTGPGRRAGDMLAPLPRPASGETYRCPDGACGLEVPRAPGGPIPKERCWLRNRPLTAGEA
ncbi:hypothetical protein [Actinokineospora fastidiosa]|uniref:Uncharacterized protein n=1 Tax=Actinokineospora fastidiosa TaxID=1816 RepID=A0A918LIL5_9PSEU|nr:hypothetical protein [Actinokineospora fastidiosa]GGS56899.1 hypothetical protein GCM10010171_59930 [Actinokineospora fastidiosa]